MSKQKLDEFSLSSLSFAQPAVSDDDGDEVETEVTELPVVSQDSSDDDSMAIGDVKSEAPPKNITVYAGTISPTSYGGDENIACFDVVFSVGISCEGESKTYQVVKRIGIDKQKIAAQAEASTPVSVVEAVRVNEARTVAKVEKELEKAKAALDKNMDAAHSGKSPAKFELAGKVKELEKELADLKKSESKPLKEQISTVKRARQLAGLE